MSIRILIADDHAVVRKGLRSFLELDPDLKILAAAPADHNLVGKTFNRSISGVSLESILKAAQVGDKNYYDYKAPL